MYMLLECAQSKHGRKQVILTPSGTSSLQACKVVLVDLQRLQGRGLLQVSAVHSGLVLCSTIATPPVNEALQYQTLVAQYKAAAHTKLLSWPRAGVSCVLLHQTAA